MQRSGVINSSILHHSAWKKGLNFPEKGEAREIDRWFEQQLAMVLAPSKRRTLDDFVKSRFSVASFSAQLLPILETLNQVEMCLRTKRVPATTALVDLLEVSAELESIDLGESGFDGVIASAEIPLRTALLFPGRIAAPKQLSRALKKLCQLIDETFDSDGMPHSQALEFLPQFWGIIVRTMRTSLFCGQELWEPETRKLLQAGCRRTLGICRPLGVAPFAQGETDAEFAETLRLAVRLLGLSNSEWQVKRLDQSPGTGTKRSHVKLSPEACGANQSDWGAIALLKNGASSGSDSLLVSHHRSIPQIELLGCGYPLLSGNWQLNVQLDEIHLELADAWSCVCWNSDEDGDYVELQMRGPRGIYIERFLFLPRSGGYAVLTDIVRGSRAKNTRIQSSIPLAPGIDAVQSDEQREVYLTRRGQFAGRIYPLAMPDVRTRTTPHTLSVQNGLVTLDYQRRGGAFAAPVVIDWDPTRRKSAAVWRSLTVTENQEICSSEAAAGYRIHSGSLHLVMYRSLKSTQQARAVLGLHTHRETAICQMEAKGVLKSLLLVEA